MKKTDILYIKLIFTTKNANLCYNSFMMVHDCVALHKMLTTPSINVSYISINCLIIPLDIMKLITTFCRKLFYLYDL